MRGLAQRLQASAKMAWPSTLDPKTIGAGSTLSNGNLTLTHTIRGYSAARGTNPRSSGKWYFEVKLLVTGTNIIGFARVDGFQNGNYLGGYANSCGYTLEDTFRYPPGQGTAGLGSAMVNDIAQVCVDLDAAKIWYGLNNTYLGNPAAGLGAIHTGYTGPMVPAIAQYDNGASVSVRFSAGFTYAPPAGFSIWG
jgi:hypothetical protein